MRKIIFLGLMLCLSLGCARVRVEAPKEPIKMDITMRLDIYQHVQKDIDAVENIVSGASKEQAQTSDKQSTLSFFIASAYAQDGLDPQVEEAALRRKGRLAELSSWQAKGVIGENKDALVEVSDPQAAGAAGIVGQENADRMIIYQAIAKKNGTSLAEVQMLYAVRLQASAPSGTPVQSSDGSWRVK